MKNEKEDFNIQTIIQKDQDKELKLLLLPNWENYHILNKENSEKQSIIEFSVSCFSLKIIKLLFKLNSEIKYFKNNLTDENLIHICLINNEFSSGTFDNSAQIRNGNANNSQYQYNQICNSNIYNSNINNNYKPNETKKSNSNKTYKEGYYSKYYQKTISTFNSKRPKCETIHFLISEGIPFSKDNEGNTEIHKLLFHACKECLDYFLALPIVKSENRKYLYEKNKHGLNPYELSIKTGNYETFNILESYYRQENYIGLIHLCAYGGNIKILKDLLNSIPQSPRKNQNNSILNTLNIDGKSPFTLSLINNHFKFANYLLDKGAKPTNSDLELVKGGINIDLFKKINNFLQKNNNSLSMNTQRPKSQTRYSICSLSENDNKYNKPQLNQCQNVFKFEENMKEEEEKIILNKINSNNTSSNKSPNIYVSGKIYNKMKNYNKSLNMNNLSINNIQIDNEKYQVDILNKEKIKENNNLRIDPIDFSEVKPNSINCFYKPSDSQKNDFLRSTQYTSAYNEVLSNLSNEHNNKIEINKKTNTPIISNKNPLMLNHTKPHNITKYLKESKRTISSHMFSITTSSNIEYMFRKSSSDGLQLIDSFSKEKEGDYSSNFYSVYNQFAFDMNLVRNISVS